MVQLFCLQKNPLMQEDLTRFGVDAQELLQYFQSVAYEKMHDLYN